MKKSIYLDIKLKSVALLVADPHCAYDTSRKKTSFTINQSILSKHQHLKDSFWTSITELVNEMSMPVFTEQYQGLLSTSSFCLLLIIVL